MSQTNLEGRMGDTFTRVITWEDSAGDAIDLTGASVEWALRYGNDTFQYEDTAQASITDAAAGEVTLTLTPTETRALSTKRWQYEVTITLSDSTRTTILHGTLTMAGEVVA